MRMQFSKIAFAIAFAVGLCFAQNVPEQLAVYTYGASDAGINKSLSYKLLVTMVQSGMFAEINDPSSFQDELAKSGKNDLASIVQTSKRYGADYVCAVNITEVFDTHSIAVRLIKIAGSQVIKTGSIDRSLKSLEDLTAVSNELARQLLPAAVAPPPVAIAPPPVAATPPPDAVYVPTVAALVPEVAAVQKRCERTYNINELLFKIKDNFPSKLKDCSTELAKNMLNPFGKKLEPKSFMTQCSIDGIKKELPDDFPDVDKVLGNLTNFVQGIMNTAMSGGGLDPKKLISAVASMNVSGLLNEIKKLSNNECVVDEPYDPNDGYSNGYDEDEDEGYSDYGNYNRARSFDNKNTVSFFGIRAGINSSIQRQFNRIEMHAGAVLDISPIRNWFHIQPGLMYIRREIRDEEYANGIEIPLLFSFKPSKWMMRFSVGPYFSLLEDVGVGLTFSQDFDIGMFHIGAFIDMSRSAYNPFTPGLNLGINL